MEDQNVTLYPIRFDKCPVCKSSNRIVEREVAIEIENGKLKAGSKVPALITKAVLHDPTALIARKKVTALIGFYDVCSACGTLYCVETQRHEIIVEPQLNRGNGQNGRIA